MADDREDLPPTSRLPGFYRAPLAERREAVIGPAVPAELAAHLEAGGALPLPVADRMSENVIAQHGLPLSIATNFRVNGRDVLLPMAVEEPSVVAAASNAARMVRTKGGFHGEATEAVMTAQVQLDAVPDAAAAPERLAPHRARLLEAADRAIPGMVRRGGGCRDLEVRVIDEAEGLVVVHFYVAVGDAMGANVVDTVAEAVAADVATLLGGQVGLRILSNLPLRRMVRVRCAVGADALGGEALIDGIVRASRFAEKDPFRAVTHNKGVMNGVDAVAVALGQDWRAIEAGAHAWASLRGAYGPLAVWWREDDGLVGELEMPLAVATVGGATGVHPGVRAGLSLLGNPGARELAVIVAAAGLASNLAALRALAGEGIQRGHMRLHARKAELEGAAEKAMKKGGGA
ncbi:MAG TPA: hydroxymethylglutaryl-CoA reductase, degradative [Polyangiaceae bacterium LLY-WYZ-15_(1-7)]|nr:hydroxymethylglutaryl-CoA reductase, degradative [Sandaracinus sp.]HJL02852.1 hydroxymethylglutaryl-CoA reductase, degradative [Polyangiaceae bacterium LLY-WYZ-15_(1-7)]MBJ70341.1 hydroxymethylglutaryl-CoA reductase, degradative [Sandaracinus sp.]HJL12180.1 hydroxymethylglutaryl-CoA reductase, degradative [Polyangiaceae bacterium LLY-WYZ-15_(1-7)]HJL23588.1 hydroxymethylglutaryl-CoA reductase, degradative [Polyangiaceae bacterium LLY-WYZ-15_(1-7)]